MRVGVLKPDHLGDLILSFPAISALAQRFPGVILYCHPQCLALARFLFPGIESQGLLLPHLDKDLGPDPDTRTRIARLRREIDLLICLRWDGQIERLLVVPEIEIITPGAADSNCHVALEQQAFVASFCGTYDLLSSWPLPVPHRRPTARPKTVGRVGLCIAAGFRLNAWPLGHWAGLAERLHRKGICVVLLGGPNEAARLAVLQEVCSEELGYRPPIVIGTSRFSETLSRFHESCDLVIATDSGAGHLVSLVVPVISLFGGSPWRRYAPLGHDNIILTREQDCSPCEQFDRSALNLCHMQECLTNLMPAQVVLAVETYLNGREFDRPVRMGGILLAQAPWRIPELMQAELAA